MAALPWCRCIWGSIRLPGPILILIHFTTYAMTFRPGQQSDPASRDSRRKYENSTSKIIFIAGPLSNNLFCCFVPSPYPWTALGYTYDWGNPIPPHFGLSEFVINSGTTGIDVFIKSCKWTGDYFNNWKIAADYQFQSPDYNLAIRLKSARANAYSNRAIVYLNQGNKELWCCDARKACELENCKILEAAKDRGYCRWFFNITIFRIVILNSESLPLLNFHRCNKQFCLFGNQIFISYFLKQSGQ